MPPRSRQDSPPVPPKPQYEAVVDLYLADGTVVEAGETTDRIPPQEVRDLREQGAIKSLDDDDVVAPEHRVEIIAHRVDDSLVVNPPSELPSEEPEDETVAPDAKIADETDADVVVVGPDTEVVVQDTNNEETG